jgi:quercetin dioxygenase-like cupin family protein
MQTVQLLADRVFHDKNANAQPLFVDQQGRILRFTLKPEQSIREHNAPHSPFYGVVLKGEGMFAGVMARNNGWGLTRY